MSYGVRIRRYREGLGLSQEELARRADLSVATIVRWEGKARRPRRPHGRLLRRVAKALRTSVLELVKPGRRP